MEKLLFLLFASIIALGLQAQPALNFMTFNIRYNNPEDSMNAWPNRSDFVAIRYYFTRPI